MASHDMRDECKVLFEVIGRDLKEIKKDIKSMIGNSVHIKIQWFILSLILLSVIGLAFKQFGV